MHLLRTSTLPWLFSAAAHLALVCGVVRAHDDGPPKAPVTVEIIHRAPPPPPPKIAAGPPAAAPAPRPIARRQPRVAPRAVTPPLPAVAMAPPSAVPSPSAPVLPVVATSAPAARPLRAGGGGTDLSGYLGHVNRVVASRRRYPALAVQMALEGTVEVRVRVNADGTLASRPMVLRSSGHELLDDEALQMIARAAPFPPLPSDYGGATADLRVPVRFFLD